MIKRLLFFLFVTIALNTKSQLVNYHLQQSFTATQLDSFLNSTGFSLPIGPQYDIEVYQVIYKTPYKHLDSLVNASGIVVVPKNTTCPSALGCYAHGTFARRDQVPSYNGPERPIGFFFAGIGGVVTAMPDELGLGDSDSSIIIHPYVNAFHTGYAAINIMRAARQLCDTLAVPLSGEVAITGYSQGGYSTMAIAKLIQDSFQNEFNVVALAPMSGPYDLKVTMVNQMLSFTPYATPSYLPYLLLGYHSVYPSLQQLYPNPADIFKSPYDTILPAMFYSRNYSTGDIDAFCDPIPRNMIKDSIMDAFVNDLNHPLRTILAENDMLDWAPAKPVKIAYCTADEQVNYHNAIQADSAWRANGAPNIELVNYGNTNHGGCVQPALTATALFILGKLSTCSGIKETPAFNFHVFPNPSNGNFKLITEEGTYEVAVYNSNGQCIYQSKVNNEIESISLGKVAAGVYAISLRNNNGQTVHQKLVVQ